jgi:carbon starvation protein
MLQEALGLVWAPLGRTSWYPSSVLASLLVVAAWGWFLVQGVRDPNGGINSLWPLFGISNQLLATVALCVATTVLVKHGRARLAWVTIVPLCWLLVVTGTAGWQKIFAADPRLGFLALARATEAKLADGSLPEALARQVIFNARLDAALAALFLTVTALVVVASVREWWRVMAGRTTPVSTETPFVESAYAS